MGKLVRSVILLLLLGVVAVACGDDSNGNAGAVGDDDAAGPGHGADVAETDCPGTTWQRVEASAFSFSVPSDFVDQAPQAIDSEIGQWSNDDGIDVFYDFGSYSGSIADSPGAVVEPIDYSGITGTWTMVTGDPNQMEVFFDEVTAVDGQPTLLSLNVNYAASADEIIARCIVGSIDWNLG